MDLIDNAIGTPPPTRASARFGLRPRQRPATRRPPWALIGVATAVAAWALVARLALWPPIFVPPPGAVLHQLVVTSTTYDGIRGYSGSLLIEHLWATLRRILLGFGAAVVIGIPLGLVIGSLHPARALLEPAVTFVRCLPPLAYFSLLIIWFGIDETPKVVLLSLAALPAIVLATSEAVRSVPNDRLLIVRSLGAQRVDVVRHVVLPSILPEVFTGLRVALGFAFTTVVAAETVNGLPGLGGMVRDAQRFNQTDVVVLGIIVIGLLGIALDSALRAFDRALVPWRGHQ